MGGEPFVFNRQPAVPAEQAIGQAAEECKALVPKLEELGAMLCLAGRVSNASRLCQATAMLIRELAALGKLR